MFGCTTLERARSAPGDARNWVRRWLAEADAECLSGPATLVASELVTNAVVHGAGRIELGLRREGGHVTVRVSDQSSGPAVRRAARSDDTHGRGLSIVDRLAAEWGTVEGEDVKTVWACLVVPDKVHDEVPGKAG